MPHVEHKCFLENCAGRWGTHSEDEVDAGHLIDNEGLKAEEEDAEVVHPLQHRRHSCNIHQVAREKQTQQQHLQRHAAR